MNKNAKRHRKNHNKYGLHISTIITYFAPGFLECTLVHKKSLIKVHNFSIRIQLE